MSVISFYSCGDYETSQTASMAAIATHLAIEQNYKILLINTKHNDMTLQDCFWEPNKVIRRNDLETGISRFNKGYI